jgi:hypothetical protein
MSAKKIWYFVKFFEKEEHADQFIKGTLYLNRLSYFRNIEEDSCADGWFDKTEAVAMWLQPHDLIIEVKMPGVGEAKIAKENLGGPVSISYNYHDHFHIYCLYAVHTTGFATIDGKLELTETEAAELQKQVAIDERCFKSRPFAVIVPAVRFLSQVSETLRGTGHRVRGKLVEYYDDETFHGEIVPDDIPFKKQKGFSYQKEFRICVQTNTIGNDPLLIDIGDISHICSAKMPSARVSEVFKLFKLEPASNEIIAVTIS